MSLDPKLSQIRWRCHRGMRELDLLLLRFFDQHYQHLSPVEQRKPKPSMSDVSGYIK